MRKWTACVAVMGIATIGFGLARTVTRQEAQAQAEVKAQAPIPGDPFQPLIAPDPDPFAEESIPSKPSNPFRRVAVPAGVSANEELSPPRSRPRLTEDHPTEDLDESVAFRNPRPASSTRQVPSYPGAPSVRAIIQDTDPPPATEVPRVKLLLTPDHQIQIFAAGIPDAVARRLQGSNPILITAETFQLTPLSDAGAGNQISCSGAVEIRAAQFTASGTKLSILKGELVLEGTAEHPAIVTKTAAPTAAPTAATTLPTPVPDRNFREVDGSDQFSAPAAPVPARSPPVPIPAVPNTVVVKEHQESSPAPEFRVSANRITFTLNLDRLQVGNATVIAPAAGAPAESKDAPGKPTEVKPLEPNGRSDAQPLPPPVPQDAPAIDREINPPSQS